MSEGKDLWSAQELASATGGSLTQADWTVRGLQIDSRIVQPGDLFIALQGERDGHDYLEAAFARGAAGALVARQVPGIAGPMLVVDDTLAALQRLGGAARTRCARRVAVTGSVGKTSTKELIAAALSSTAPTHFAVKSFNNHIGVPLTLARAPAGSRFGVFEVGMNHRGEIAPLAQLVRPHIAIVTTVAPVHLEHLGTLEAIADEKADIFTGLEPGGLALIPGDLPPALRERLLDVARANGAEIVLFGRGSECAVRLLSFESRAEDCHGRVDLFGSEVAFRIGAPGAHWATNAIAALAAATKAGGRLMDALDAFAGFGALAGRGAAREIAVSGGTFTLIDESYNANPASMAAAFHTLKGRPARRHIAALGDMLELGQDELAFHAGLSEAIESAQVDYVFCAGDRMRALWDALPASRRGAWAQTAEALAPVLASFVRAGDVITVKGSNGARMSSVVNALAALHPAQEAH